MTIFLKRVLLTIASLALVLCVSWAVMEPGWGSATSTLFSLIALLTVASDPEISTRLGNARKSAIARAEKSFNAVFKARHENPVSELTSFSLPDEPGMEHQIGIHLLRDARCSGLIKAIVHLPPKADPYDIMTIEGASPRFQVLNLESRPALFVDTVVGAHSHQVRIFRLTGQNRFEEIGGSPLFADWGPVELEQTLDAESYQITVLRGPGAAGSNAEPHKYMLSDRGLQPIEESA